MKIFNLEYTTALRSIAVKKAKINTGAIIEYGRGWWECQWRILTSPAVMRF